MVLTALLVCLWRAIGCLRYNSRCVRSISLGLMVLCIPLLTGCGDNPGTSPLTDLAMAKAGNGNGNAYGLHPTISLSPTGLNFSATQGGSDPAAQTVTISNSGNGTLNWSVSTTAPWLALSSVSGTAPASFNATVILAGLAAGTYSTIITVTATGSTNTPQSIPVDLIILTSTSSTSTPTTTTSATTTASASLAWDPNTDPSVVGYYVHYGLQSPNSPGSCAYSNSAYYSLASLANASSPTATISGLAMGTMYYFTVSAYNGIESACSNETSKTT